jgi:hypothetical protein
MVPADRILGAARAEGVDVIGLSGLITPSLDEMVHVAGELEREGFAFPCSSGGHDLPGPHRGEDRGALRGPHRPCGRRSRAVGVVSRAPDPRTRRVSSPRVREEYAPSASGTRAPRAGAPAFAGEARANAFPVDWASYEPPAPRAPGATSSTGPARGAARVHRLDALLPGVGAAGKYPDILSDPTVGEAASRLLADAGSSSTRSWRGVARAAGASSGSGRPAPWATTSSSTPRRRDGDRARIHTLRQQFGRDGDRARTWRSPTSSHPGVRGPRLGGRLRRHGRATGSTRSWPASIRSTTTTGPSWRSRSPTGWPRPSPSSCTSGCAGSSGGTRRRGALERGLIAERYRGSGRRPATRPARTTPRSGPSSALDAEARSGSGSPRAAPCSRPRR